VDVPAVHRDERQLLRRPADRVGRVAVARRRWLPRPGVVDAEDPVDQGVETGGCQQARRAVGAAVGEGHHAHP
jgi:hypothetical protein